MDYVNRNKWTNGLITQFAITRIREKCIYLSSPLFDSALTALLGLKRIQCSTYPLIVLKTNTLFMYLCM